MADRSSLTSVARALGAVRLPRRRRSPLVAAARCARAGPPASMPAMTWPSRISCFPNVPPGGSVDWSCACQPPCSLTGSQRPEYLKCSGIKITRIQKVNSGVAGCRMCFGIILLGFWRKGTNGRTVAPAPAPAAAPAAEHRMPGLDGPALRRFSRPREDPKTRNYRCSNAISTPAVGQRDRQLRARIKLDPNNAV